MMQIETIVCYRICRQFMHHVVRRRIQHVRLGSSLKIAMNFMYHRRYSSKVTGIVLGIETSCDDTGCAIVDSNGKILGEALNSQQQIHLNHGGIIPPIARDLHKQHIEHVVHDALRIASIELSDVDAIATTVKPGLPLSLVVGMNYGKHLSRTSGKPLIPVHHMEAHALTIRMVQKVDFPFLVLLISGGHCLLAVVQAVDKFLLLGQSLDDAPGEAFDKAARRLKLRNLPEFRTLSGGRAIELAASKSTDPQAFEFPMVMAQYRDCNFSMAGIKNCVRRHILQQEKLHGVEGDELIPDVFNLCAGIQMAVTRHLCQRLQRGMEFVTLQNLLPRDNKTLVLSGGVACNTFIKRAMGLVCQHMGYSLAVPPPHLCTDNGIMIAWNGIERLCADIGITHDLDSVDIDSKCPLGEDWTDKVAKASIKCKWIKLTPLLKEHSTSQE
ncbi:putative tRNA N6-adenosine threonylcarbamoyltransferase, mitochondrial [Cryptotermes secundus]|uniref:N(6)-L-threonylcarbamoyladenine synthase n=1 Tax=Cryptotermes secundus TaxID=105785 RepID=A0A2J7RR99_9NEOP|nr:probable tRNA N6-adenosine threonylcarbamoyltransferase, mitochondrial isoform X1 [Cryptotermes secundus]PNF43359.1 putative tRNA N6-adenosine threonylcarbamoyltransferase, mitochondrial [Cryptotermes secundus]